MSRSTLFPQRRLPDTRVYYTVSDSRIDKLVVEVSKHFNEEKKHGDFSKSKEKMEAAIALMREKLNGKTYTPPKLKYDLAFLLRRYASIVIRDKRDPACLRKARGLLEEAIGVHGRSTNEVLFLIEEARVCHQLRAVYYKLRLGDYLEQVVPRLDSVIYSKDFPSDLRENYQLDVYETNFHMHFAKGELLKAEKALECVKKKMSTYYRHLSKINLAKLVDAPESIANIPSFFRDEIEGNFWRSYDENKKRYRASYGDRGISRKQTEEAILKDLMFLFSIRCQKTLLGLHDGKFPFEYVLHQMKELFFDRYTIYFVNDDFLSIDELLTGVIAQEHIVVQKTLLRDIPVFYLYLKAKGYAGFKMCTVDDQSDPDFYEELLSVRYTNKKVNCSFRVVANLSSMTSVKMPKAHKHPLCTVIEGLLQEKIENAKRTFQIPLSYQYFDEYEPPSIYLVPREVQELFGEHLSEDEAHRSGLGALS